MLLKHLILNGKQKLKKHDKTKEKPNHHLKWTLSLTPFQTAVGLPPTNRVHYWIPRLCREHLTLGRGTIPLDRGCAERKLSAQRTRHRWAGEEPFAESHVRSTRYTCAESGILLSATEIS
jgi:hypothetical protein